jgi:hypothetical protein
VTEELSPRARAILEAAERMVSGGAPIAPPPAPPSAPAAAPAPASAAQLAALAESVRVALESVRGRLDELSARVDALALQLQQQPPAPRVVEPPPPPRPPTPDPEDAPRLLAVELAVAGATRADVDAALRTRFGVSSTAELLDQVFGVGSSPGAHLPWGGAA